MHQRIRQVLYISSTSNLPISIPRSTETIRRRWGGRREGVDPASAGSVAVQVNRWMTKGEQPVERGKARFAVEAREEIPGRAHKAVRRQRIKPYRWSVPVSRETVRATEQVQGEPENWNARACTRNNTPTPVDLARCILMKWN